MVLVTGGSGFVGAYCIRALLAGGHEVRTTVRSLGKAVPEGAEVVLADLTSDAGWAEAVAGCEFVLHVASPFPPRPPEHEDDLIVPARDGTLRVLRAARDAGVERVVLTSSFAAIGYSGPGPFTEADWTHPDGQPAYVKSKTLAERAAWEFVAGQPLELVVINPTVIFGPVLGPDYASSIELVKRLQDGLPGVPKVEFGVVDVRDVADLHLLAMTAPEAAGERFIAVSEVMSMGAIARALGVKTRELPNWLVRIAAHWIPQLRAAVPELGRHKEISSEKARRVLGWTPRPGAETIAATGESLRG
jgi:nucleoside-diphosphate-sugar epimerase